MLWHPEGEMGLVYKTGRLRPRRARCVHCGLVAVLIRPRVAPCANQTVQNGMPFSPWNKTALTAPNLKLFLWLHSNRWRKMNVLSQVWILTERRSPCPRDSACRAIHLTMWIHLDLFSYELASASAPPCEIEQTMTEIQVWRRVGGRIGRR